MAATFTPTHISSARLLELVDQKILLELIAKYADFFKHHGVYPEAASAIDYDKLALALASPNTLMPGVLVADLFYWDEVAEMATIEDLVEIAERHRVKLADDVTVEEACLRLRLAVPGEIEDLHAIYHAHGLLRKRKRFLSYYATVATLPEWQTPSQAQLDAFANEMDNWYQAQKKGRGTRVFVVEKSDAAWLIVRHGGACRRENALEDGEPRMVFYRPEAYDLLIYYHQHGELAICNAGSSAKERRTYCTKLGAAIFGDSTFFETANVTKYTLEPLRKLGRASMDCSEIEGLHDAQLTQLVYRFSGSNQHRVEHHAEDVFAGLEALGHTIPEDASLICMGVKFMPDRDLGGERTVKVYAPNVSIFDHESDALLAHRFLTEQGFILPRVPRDARPPDVADTVL